MGNVTTRLFALIMLLESRPTWTADELAARIRREAEAVLMRYR